MTKTASPRGNAARPLRASNLTVDLVELAGVVRRFVKCPCGNFAQVKRNELTAHTTPDGVRCANSRRALINDLEEADWTSAYDRTARQIERFRSPGPRFTKPNPPVVRPVAHLGRSNRSPHPAQTSGHDAENLARLDKSAKARPTC